MFSSYPDLYNVLVLTNPLVDLAALASNSDVPDLAWQLLGFNYTVKSLPADVVNVAWEKYWNLFLNNFPFICFYLNLAFEN